MFWIAIIWLMFKPARLRTVGSFTAEDPWNQNRRSSFTLEAYMLAPKGFTPKADTKIFGGIPLYGIRSEVDGVERMLPESLTYLCRNNRVPAEKLPWLLKEMGPMLRKTDFRLQFLTKAMTVMQYVLSGLFGLLLLALLAAAVLSPSASDGMVIGIFVAVLGLLCFGVLYLMFFRPRARRRRQMNWALEHI
jgi:hypothetical protein